MLRKPLSLSLLVFIVSFSLRFPSQKTIDTMNWYNSDATYHMLLTIQAYDETPISIHKFLPIVSLGKNTDKWIPWGATIPDKHGNYYYTSFQPLGFFAPWIFHKIFNLTPSVQTLYIFNSILQFFCGLVLLFCALTYFKHKISPLGITVLTSAIYLLAPEIMHSQGIVYWNHSLYQLVFIVQIYFLLHAYPISEEFTVKQKWHKVGFWVLSFIIPLVEWTGFISNGGILLYLIYFDIFQNKKPLLSLSVIKKIVIMSTTIIAGVLILIFHFNLNVDLLSFLKISRSRYVARASNNFVHEIIHLISLYRVSFGYFLYFIPLSFLVLIYKKASRQEICIKRHLPLLFLLLFPLLENILLLEHARSYSFDRIKSVYLLVFIALMFVKQLPKKIVFPLSLIVLLVGIVQLSWYTSQNNHYIYPWSNKNINNFRQLVLAGHADPLVLALYNSHVRGFQNLNWHQGIKEWGGLDHLNLEYGIPALIFSQEHPWSRLAEHTAIITEKNTYRFIGIVLDPNFIEPIQAKLLSNLSYTDGITIINDKNFTNFVSLHGDAEQKITKFKNEISTIYTNNPNSTILYEFSFNRTNSILLEE